MKIVKINLNQDDTKAILLALDVLKRGGTIVYPTDTIYGLGANACDQKAVEQIYKIKNRSFSKPLPIIAKDMLWVENLAFVLPKLRLILNQIWPGPITVVLAKKNVIPNIVTAHRSNIAIRIPDFPFAIGLLGKFGYPLTATSANLAGEEGTGKIDKVIQSFKGRVWKPDLVLDAGILPKSLPSTILDFSSIQPKILRVGPSKPAELMKILNIKNKKFTF